MKKMREKAGEIGLQEISQARKVLFALFSRYGDVIISLSVIEEFMERYPDKRYFVITSPQMHPYAAKLLGDRAHITSFNKRRNFIKFFQAIRLLKKENIDLGFNPWSGGDDSRFIITYAQKFNFYGDFWGISNLYDRIRNYLQLPQEDRLEPAWDWDNIRRVVICPRSTALNKSLVNHDLHTVVQWVRQKLPDAGITIALQEQEAKALRGVGKTFVFRKSRSASAQFLGLLENTDLVISVDAGPLHLADKLGIRTLGIFGPTCPQGVLDRTTRVVPLRDRSLAKVFCSAPCRENRCLRRLLQGDLLEHQVKNAGEMAEVEWETELCRLR
jgi:ADP-heptose:LPS heptosyltransferase